MLVPGVSTPPPLHPTILTNSIHQSNNPSNPMPPLRDLRVSVVSPNPHSIRAPVSPSHHSICPLATL